MRIGSSGCFSGTPTVTYMWRCAHNVLARMLPASPLREMHSSEGRLVWASSHTASKLHLVQFLNFLRIRLEFAWDACHITIAWSFDGKVWLSGRCSANALSDTQVYSTSFPVHVCKALNSLNFSAHPYQSFLFSTYWLFLTLLPETSITWRQASTSTLQDLFRGSHSGEVRSLRTIL